MGRYPTVLSLILSLGISFLGAGCDNACTELNNKRCRCERTEAEQRACLQRVDSLSGGRDLTTEELETCERLLDTCTCEAMAMGNIKACGLAIEYPN